MPNGRAHAIASLAGMVIVPSAMYLYGYPPAEMAACAVGFALSLWINPDLDLNTRFPKNQPSKWLWWFMWFPYARLFGHRSFWSHFPVVGTSLRVAYILVYVTLLAGLLNINIYGSQSLYWILYGLAVSDIVHGLMDTFSSVVKEVARGRV